MLYNKITCSCSLFYICAHLNCTWWFQLLAEVNSPKMKWGPANPDDRGERYKLPDYGVYSRDIMENESKVTPHQVEPILGVDSRVEGEAGAGADNLAYKET